MIITGSSGEKVTFGPDLTNKYLRGRGRSNNKAAPKRLRELPIAIYAVMNDPNPKLQYLRGAIHDPMNPPKGTQKVYTPPAADGPMITRAWVDSGKITGWYVKTKKPT